MARNYHLRRPNRALSIWILRVAIGLICLGLLSLGVYKFHHAASPVATVVQNVQGPLSPASAEKPQSFRLQIPEIKVDAPVVGVGLSSQGDMENPSTLEKVGWYKNGPQPGEIGSAVITGHYGRSGGHAAAFDNLHQLQAGDKIIIENKGVLKTFVVRETRIYDPEAKVSEIFNLRDGMHLNLITCQGQWDEAKQSYSQRLVVFTDLVI